MNSTPTIYLPVKTEIRIGGLSYHSMISYHDLSLHNFTEYEKNFLCMCYKSGSQSLIGTTSKHGIRRLTIPGIEDRYKIPQILFKQWLQEYQKIQTVERKLFYVICKVTHKYSSILHYLY